MIKRISKEAEKFPYGVGEAKKYIRFVQDWNLLTQEIKEQTLTTLNDSSPELASLWIEMVNSQDVTGEPQESIEELWKKLSPPDRVGFSTKSENSWV